MISNNLPEVVAFVSAAERLAKRAGASALKAATKDLHEEAWKLSKNRYHRLPKFANKGNQTSFRNSTLRYLRKDSSSTMASIFLASARPYSVINSVVGSRQPRPQAGKKIKRRRKIYVRISGQKHPLGKGQFIAAPIKQRAKNITHVFYKNKQGKILKESYSSLFEMLLFPENQEKLAHAATKSFLKNYDKKLKEV
jgi:hypothetical protein